VSPSLGEPGLGEATRVWLRVAALSFGGPAGQIAVMHRILVEEKGWVSEERFVHAMNFCMLLPGPEAQQLATYNGWLLHGTRGGLIAGGLFVLPGFLSILLLSILYVGFGDLWIVEGAFYGMKAAMLAVVVEALLRIGKRVLKNPLLKAFSALAFLALFVFGLPFPLVILGAGLAGMVGARLRPALFLASGPDAAAAVVLPTLWSTARTAGIWLAIWLVPMAVLLALLGPEHVFVQIGALFSTAAVVTFGGAYAVLAWIAQQAVEVHGWLSPGEMLDGLGMAETTPGPLIQVVQFVGFLAAYRDAGALHPLLAGVAGAVLTTWVTFAPCFLWIFTGAPYVEWLRGRRALSAALTAITAAVVGVILNLAIWFALHIAFATVEERAGPLGIRLLVPEGSPVQPGAVGIAFVSFLMLLVFHQGLARTLAVAVALGLVWRGVVV